ncbi:MAG: DUF4350 domain-containing protein [Planctomycetes bacterium]|nr:DUF4350 domain-containing protein [Planctomycetota bacterium]
MRTRSSVEGLLALLLALAVLATAVVFGSSKNRDADLRATSWNDERRGAHALYLLLEDCGVPVARETAPPASIADSPTARTIVVLAPSWAVSKAEARSLLDWAAKGGRLVVVDAPSTPPAQMIDVDPLLHPAGLETKNASGKGDDVKVLDGEWAADVADVHWSPRLVLHDRNAAVAPVVVTPAPPGAPATPSAPNPAESTATPTDERASPPETLVESADGPLVARVRFGAGEVVAIADAQLLANETLGRGDNALLVVRILSDPARSAVAFDEFHHGYTATGVRAGFVERLAGMVVHTWVGRAFLLVALAGLVFAGGAAVRLGAPLPEAAPPRRALREHADALGRLLEGAHASREVLEILGSGAGRVCGARAGFAPGLSPAEFRNRLDRSLAPGARELAAALADAEASSLKPSVKDVELARIAANLAAAKRRFLHGGV